MTGSIAPIVMFCFNRPAHVERTLLALSQNALAAESDLYVFCDGPRSDSDVAAVDKVREVVENAQGFNRVIVTKSERNRGLANSVIHGVTEIVRKHGRVIVLEDDLVTSPFFLKYMNDALEFYKDEERVISVHGYTYPVKGELPETFFLCGADCWGWATWKRGWDMFEPDGAKLLDELKRRGLTRRFDFNGAYSYTRMLKDQIAGKKDSWAIRWHASAFLKDRLTLYPGKSLISNIGNDDSGTHCVDDDVFDVQVSGTGIEVRAIPLTEHPDSLREFGKYLKSVRRKKIVNFAVRKMRQVISSQGN